MSFAVISVVGGWIKLTVSPHSFLIKDAQDDLASSRLKA
jgi:hypothetical protein